METIATVLFISNFVLSAIAASLAAVLFRHYRHAGWLMLATVFLWPFFTLVVRLLKGEALLSYRSTGHMVNGGLQASFYLQFPVFYMVVVAALLLLWRDARRDKST